MNTSVADVINGLPLKQNSKILIIGDLPLRYITLFTDKVGNNNVTLLKIKNAESKKHDFKEIFYDIDNGKKLPFRSELFDVLFVFHTLRYVIYRESLLKEFTRILKPGGLNVIIESKINAFSASSHPDAKIIFDDMLEYLDRANFLLGENFDTNQDEYGIISICPIRESE